jgi:hypothetical protein
MNLGNHSHILSSDKPTLLNGASEQRGTIFANKDSFSNNSHKEEQRPAIAL